MTEPRDILLMLYSSAMDSVVPQMIDGTLSPSKVRSMTKETITHPESNHRKEENTEVLEFYNNIAGAESISRNSF